MYNRIYRLKPNISNYKQFSQIGQKYREEENDKIHFAIS